ncbi:hypothetical protein [Chryseobacterium lineare]
MQKTLLLILSFSLFISCQKTKKDINNKLDAFHLNSKSNSLENNDSDSRNTVYDIKGENIFLRDGPGKNYKKIVNQKATDIIGETQYIQIDYTCTVSVEEEKNDWAKVRVVDPSYLSETHYGWIPVKNIVKSRDQNPIVDVSKLQYDIISTTENNVSKNYNIYINIKNLSKDEIISFIKQFREKNCTTCSISIFDTKSIKELIDIYPLSKTEYLKFADHFVAWSTFDAPKLVSFYPFQDSKYKEYGGKNFKEQKMK